MNQTLLPFIRFCCITVLTICSVTVALSQSTTPQAATTTATGKTTQLTGPGGKPLTPAEIRLREKQAKWIEDQRRYKAEMAELQRRAQMEQLEKERKKKEKEEAKAREKQEREATKLAKQQPEAPKTQPETKPTEPVKPITTNQPAETSAPVSSASPFTPVSETDKTDSKRIAKEKKDAEEQSRKEAREAEKIRERQQKEADRIARQQADEAEKTRIRQQKEARDIEARNRRQAQEAETEKAKLAKEARDAEDRNRRQAQESERTQEKQAKESTIRVMESQKVATAPAPTPASPVVEPTPVEVKPEVVPNAVASSSTRPEFLPKGHLFAPILLDPLEAQTYGSVLPSFVIDRERYKGAIVPFAFGFIKPFYRWGTKKGGVNEIGLDLASYTQFEVYRDKDNVQRRQIMNNDYKVSIFYNIRRGHNSWRFRGYHLSSHLGDDYLIRNQINYRTPNPVNYELLDVTYSRDAVKLAGLRYYVNLGYGLRKPAERAKVSAQLGLFYRKADPAEGRAKAIRPVAGIDVKFWQQTDFRPGIHFGAGIEVGRSANNITFLLESYTGFRPYSQYENQQVQWFGIGMYLNPF